MLKKILALLLISALALSMIPIAASADAGSGAAGALGAGTAGAIAGLQAADGKVWNAMSNLQLGSVLFSDDTKTLASCPAELLGSDWVQPAKNSRGTAPIAGVPYLASFTAAQDCTVYVACSNNANITTVLQWLAADGWAKSALADCKNSDASSNVHTLYQKHFSAGSTVNLGYQNYGSAIMYFVIVKADNAVTYTPGSASIAVTAPSGTLYAIPTNIAGTVDDGFNCQYITGVKAAARDDATGLYLDGIAFASTARVDFSAAVDKAARVWSLPLNATFTAGHSYTVYAYYIDSAPSPDAAGQFTIDPSVVISGGDIDVSSAYFDLNTGGADYKDINVNMTLNGVSFVSLACNSAALTQGNQYYVAGNTLTIKKEYLQTLAKNTSCGFTFAFSQGPAKTLTVTVIDSNDLICDFQKLSVCPNPWNLMTDAEIGKEQYSDRTGIQFTPQLPALFYGAPWIQTPNNTKNYINTEKSNVLATFSVTRPTDIYVAHCDQIGTKPAWLSAWTNTGLTFHNSYSLTEKSSSFTVFKKHFNAMDAVSLGNVGGSTSDSMYTVFLLSNVTGNCVTAYTAPAGAVRAAVTSLAGTAKDPDGDSFINGVSVTVRQRSTGKYLDAASKSFTGAPAANPASYDIVSKIWTLNTAGVDFTADTYDVSAVTNDGSDGAPAAGSFTINPNVPGDAAAAVTSPGGSVSASPQLFAGTAADPVYNGFIRRVLVSLKNAGGMYYDPAAKAFVSASELYFPADYDYAGATWTYQADGAVFPGGTYTVSARADDGAPGQPAVSQFTVLSNTPGDASAVINSPADGAVLGGAPVIISGTASDPINQAYVKGVKVSVENASGQYLRADTGRFAGGEYLISAAFDPADNSWSADLSNYYFKAGSYTVSACAFDGARGAPAVSTFSVNKPANITGNGFAGLTSPSGTAASGPGALKGTAYDPDGNQYVASVKVTLQNGLGRYLITANAAYDASASECSLDVSGLTFPNDTYTVSICVNDGADSQWYTGAFTVMAAGGGPLPPRNLMTPPAARTSDTVDVMWDKPNDCSNVAGYNVYANGVLAGSTTKGNFKLTGLTPGASYDVAAKSFDAGGAESIASNAITVTAKPVQQVFNVKAYGAAGDGAALDTPAIQAAIDACAAAGGGVIEVPSGTYLTGALFLKSNQTLWLENADSVLLGVADAANLDRDYPRIKSRYEGFQRDTIYASLITVDGGRDARPASLTADSARFGVHDVTICGKGVINASGNLLSPMEQTASDRMDRSNTITIINAENIYIQGITVVNSPNWCIHPIYSKNISLEGLDEYSNSDGQGHGYSVANCDGFDPDSSVNVYYYNVSSSTGDDNVAIKSGVDAEGYTIGLPTVNVRITDSLFRSGSGMAMGSEMSGGIDGVFVQDVTCRNTGGIQVKTRRGRGGYVRNVFVDNMTWQSASEFGILLNMAYSNGYTLPQRDPADPGTPHLSNFTFQNITIGNTYQAIQFLGLPESYIQNLLFKNVTINAAAGISSNYVKGARFENVVINVKGGPVTSFDNSSGFSGVIGGTSPDRNTSALIRDLTVYDTLYTDTWAIENNLQLNDSLYNDYAGCTVSNMPGELAGCDWIAPAYSSRTFAGGPAGFTMGGSGTVYIAAPTTLEGKPDWMDATWADTGKTVNAFISQELRGISYEIYSKGFAAGSAVALGPNGGTVNDAMYFVIVKANVPPTGITMSAAQTSLNMKVGTKLSLKITVSPAGADPSVTWSSSNPAVATVDPATGQVTALKTGSVRITVKSNLNPAASYMFLVMINA